MNAEELTKVVESLRSSVKAQQQILTHMEGQLKHHVETLGLLTATIRVQQTLLKSVVLNSSDPSQTFEHFKAASSVSNDMLLAQPFEDDVINMQEEARQRLLDGLAKAIDEAKALKK